MEPTNSFSCSLGAHRHYKRRVRNISHPRISMCTNPLHVAPSTSLPSPARPGRARGGGGGCGLSGCTVLRHSSKRSEQEVRVIFYLYKPWRKTTEHAGRRRSGESTHRRGPAAHCATRHSRAALASSSEGNVLGGNQDITDHTTRHSVHTGAVRRPSERAAAAARVRRNYGAGAGAFGEKALQSCQKSTATLCGTGVRSARFPPQP